MYTVRTTGRYVTEDTELIGKLRKELAGCLFNIQALQHIFRPFAVKISIKILKQLERIFYLHPITKIIAVGQIRNYFFAGNTGRLPLYTHRP